MKHYFILLFSLFILSNSVSAQKIEWLTLQEALDKNKKEPRKIFIDFYTDWCGWCKKMDVTSFTDPTVIQMLNTRYYAVKFDAETKDTIVYKDKTYHNSTLIAAEKQGRTVRRAAHDITRKFLGNRTSYPTVVFLDENSDLIAPIPGYRDAAGILSLLVYFNENLHKSTQLQGFIDDFKLAFVDQSNDLKQPDWVDINTALKTPEKKKKKDEGAKKTMVFFYADWCNSCKVMDKVAFGDSTVFNYMKEKFTMVKFNVTSKEAVIYNGTTFENKSDKHVFHDFPVSLLSGKMSFPAIIFFTEEKQPISPIKGYYDKKSIIPILKFFGEDIYKTQKWEEFIKTYSENNKG